MQYKKLVMKHNYLKEHEIKVEEKANAMDSPQDFDWNSAVDLFKRFVVSF